MRADETILCVSNLSRTAQAVELDLSGFQRPGAGGYRRRLGVSRRSDSSPIC